MAGQDLAQTRLQLRESFKRLFVNLHRAVELVNHARDLKRHGQAPLARDVLRGAIVLIHSTAEDYFRGLARAQMLREGATLRIPRFEKSDKETPLRYALRYRGKTIEEMIEAEVDAYLRHVSVNSVEELQSLLDRIGLGDAEHEPFLPRMGWIMERRHRIVHEADFADRLGKTVAGFTSDDVLKFQDGITVLQHLAIQLYFKASTLDDSEMEVKETAPGITATMYKLPQDAELDNLILRFGEATKSQPWFHLYEMADEYAPK